MTENDDKTPYDIEIYNGENTYLMGSSLLYLVPCTHAFYRQKYFIIVYFVCWSISFIQILVKTSQ